PIEVVEVGGGEVAAVQQDERPKISRQDEHVVVRHRIGSAAEALLKAAGGHARYHCSNRGGRPAEGWGAFPPVVLDDADLPSVENDRSLPAHHALDFACVEVEHLLQHRWRAEAPQWRHNGLRQTKVAESPTAHSFARPEDQWTEQAALQVVVGS